jgi:hypothetical protein
MEMQTLATKTLAYGAARKLPMASLTPSVVKGRLEYIQGLGVLLWNGEYPSWDVESLVDWFNNRSRFPINHVYDAVRSHALKALQEGKVSREEFEFCISLAQTLD